MPRCSVSGPPAAPVEAAKEVREATTGRSDNPEAFQLYLQAKFHGERDDAGRYRPGDRALQARDRDRSRLRACVGGPVAGPSGAGRLRLRADRRRLRARPRGRAARARASRRTCADGHIELGRILQMHDWNWPAADAVVPARARAGSRRRARAALGGRARAHPRPARRGARADPEGPRARSAFLAHASPGGDDPPRVAGPRQRRGRVPARARPEPDRRPRPRLPRDHAPACRGAPRRRCRSRRRSRTRSSATSL